MNDLDLCLAVVSGYAKHCVTFAIEYISETVRDTRTALVPKDH